MITLREEKEKEALISPSLRKLRKRVLRAVEQRANGQRRQGSTFSPVTTEQVLNLQWSRQFAGTTKDALGLVRRMVLHDTKKNTKMGG